MTLKELKNTIDSAIETDLRSANYIVGVIYKKDFSMGGTPYAVIKGGNCGFDWNHGKFLLWTDEILVVGDKK